MNRETLDARSKIELSNLLLQIGFKKEAVMELLAAAALFEKQKDIENAIKVYTKILSIDPENRTAQSRLDMLQPERKRAKADEIARQLMKGEESVLEFIRKLDDVLKVEESDIDAIIGLGRVFLSSGLYAEAKKIFSEAMKEEEVKDIVFPYYIEALIHLNEFDLAREKLKEAKLSFLVDRDRIAYLEALLMEKEGNPQEALEKYKKLLEKNPWNKDAEIKVEILQEILKEGKEEKIPEITGTLEKEEEEKIQEEISKPVEEISEEVKEIPIEEEKTIKKELEEIVSEIFEPATRKKDEIFESVEEEIKHPLAELEEKKEIERVPTVETPKEEKPAVVEEEVVKAEEEKPAEKEKPEEKPVAVEEEIVKTEEEKPAAVEEEIIKTEEEKKPTLIEEEKGEEEIEFFIPVEEHLEEEKAEEKEEEEETIVEEVMESKEESIVKLEKSNEKEVTVTKKKNFKERIIFL